MITGETPLAEREEIRKKINAGKIKVGLINMQAGGVGMNLQGKANGVIFINDHWTPDIKEQAIGRVWRLGSTSEKVTVYNIYARNTIDERIQYLLGKKKYFSTSILEGETAFTPAAGLHWTFDDYMELIGGTLEHKETGFKKGK
jgi:SNF2 family DNA or RNA helicase